MALETIMLDTSAYTAIKRGNGQMRRLVQTARRIVIPTTVLGELLAGFEVGTRRESNRADLDAFLASPRVLVTSMSRATAERYAVIYSYLRSMGTPLPTNDLWIGAAAMEQGTPLVTADRHFLAMPQVMTVLLDA